MWGNLFYSLQISTRADKWKMLIAMKEMDVSKTNELNSNNYKQSNTDCHKKKVK